MEVIRARTAGFCMGVSLALKKLDRAIELEKQRRIVTLGPIIHNPQVLEAYAAKKVVCVRGVEDVRAGDCVVIRAHGIPRQMEAALHRADVRLVDATCPKVKKAQLAIAEATAHGAQLLLFGEEDHPEVRGLVSQAPYGYYVFDSMAALTALPLKPGGQYVLASQTTQEKSIFDCIEACLRNSYPNMPVLATICDATCERQKEAMDIAGHVQAMVVVGGRDSGNTRRLVDVVKAQHIPTFHVEVVEELRGDQFALFSSVGLTAGASTPKSLIDAVYMFLLDA
ncbi:MAG: 4-hydroxy-3-methylbut-2-enyl diphosphate reductase [Desulfovibrionaceae bacterium]